MRRAAMGVILSSATPSVPLPLSGLSTRRRGASAASGAAEAIVVGSVVEFLPLFLGKLLPFSGGLAEHLILGAHATAVDIAIPISECEFGRHLSVLHRAWELLEI
jgi:hypothetical protein